MSLPDSTAIRYDAKPAQKRLTVAYVLAYRAPDFIRSRSLLIALEACDGIKLTVARNHSTGMARYFETWRAQVVSACSELSSCTPGVRSVRRAIMRVHHSC